MVYAQDNKLASLKGSSLEAMTFLHTLNVANNRLGDFKQTLEVPWGEARGLLCKM